MCNDPNKIHMKCCPNEPVKLWFFIKHWFCSILSNGSDHQDINLECTFVSEAGCFLFVPLEDSLSLDSSGEQGGGLDKAEGPLEGESEKNKTEHTKI